MSLTIHKSGFLTTVQDSGRRRFQRFGVNPNGAMDAAAARLINILLGNDEAEAVLEMHFPAPEILFEEEAVFAVGGADFSARLNEKPIESWSPQFAEKASLLRFDKKISGSRAYLAVKGGFKIERWLGSASTNLAANIGGFQGRSLKTGDRLFFKILSPKFENRNYKISQQLLPLYSRFPTVRVVAGAEFELLTALSLETFFKEDFVVSRNSDRMGFRLAGEPIYLLSEKELISAAVNFGTIQLLANGQLIILMADHQTSGGYPRLANVADVDLPLVAQLGTEDKIGFHLVTIEEAENLRLSFEKDLNLLKTAVKFL